MSWQNGTPRRPPPRVSDQVILRRTLQREIKRREATGEDDMAFFDQKRAASMEEWQAGWGGGFRGIVRVGAGELVTVEMWTMVWGHFGVKKVTGLKTSSCKSLTRWMMMDVALGENGTSAWNTHRRGAATLHSSGSSSICVSANYTEPLASFPTPLHPWVIRDASFPSPLAEATATATSTPSSVLVPSRVVMPGAPSSFLLL